MHALSRKYKSAIWGLITTISVMAFLQVIGFIRINPTAVIENLFILAFWWTLFSIVIYKIPYLKQNKTLLYKILGLTGVFIVIFVADSYMQIPDNPISFPLLILFWLGVFYLVLPKLFTKYRVPILVVYGSIIIYFLYARLFTAYLEKEHSFIISLLLAPIPFLMVLWIIEQWKWIKTLKAEKTKAELALLKSQINPHFFFNTLNNLYGLAVEKSDKAPELILKLSDMMRYTIYEGKEELVLLKDEMAYLENYIELHKLRFQKKVDISFKQAIDGSYKIAPLLFIILLENAFKHGVESLTQEAFIHIHAATKDSKVLFTIENNFEALTHDVANGIGLDNLKRRLQHIYPNAHQLIIEKKAGLYKAHLEIHTL